MTDNDQGQPPRLVTVLPRTKADSEQSQPVFTDSAGGSDSRKDVLIGCGGMLLVAVIIVTVLIMVFSGDEEEEVSEPPAEPVNEKDERWTPQHIWETVMRWPVTRTITEPITTFLVDHSQGLPASSAQIGQALAVAAGLVWLFAWFGSTGARIGWLLMGGGAVAMAWFGAPDNSGPVAAAVTAAAWCVLSIPIARLGSPVQVHNDIDINDHRLTTARQKGA